MATRIVTTDPKQSIKSPDYYYVRFNDKTLHSFPSRREAFAWVKENYDPPQTISVLTYEFGELESGERYFYQNDNFIREHIVE